MPDCFVRAHYIYRQHVLLLGVFLLCSVFQPIFADSPWRLDESFSDIGWLSFKGHQRSRYEALKGQFRSGQEADVSLLALRTALQADLSGEAFGFSAELMDSRQEMADDETPLGTSIVNAMELIQAHAIFELGYLPDGSERGQLKVGRYTMDLGTRRFVARNRYRNTVNNFTGVHGTWMASGGEKVQLFYTLPVHRLPTDRDGLLHNRIRLDDEDFDVQFWGAYVEAPDFIGQAKGDVFVFGLHENDRPELATSNRNFYTGGFRVYQSPQKGRGDFEIEAALQIGKSRASRSPTDVTDLDHFARFVHLEAGYTFDNNGERRCVFQFDYASGDEDPTDNENNRWDTLYGARRFDYGPTGTYGAFARSNLISPAYRFTVNPHKQVNVMFAHRFHWLASKTDAWTTGGLRDVTGNSGSYLRNQPEIRVRWEVFPGNLRIEGGVVHLFAGEFLKLARNSNGQGDSTYGYLQSIVTF
jgi:hypothetical protein